MRHKHVLQGGHLWGDELQYLLLGKSLSSATNVKSVQYHTTMPYCSAVLHYRVTVLQC